MEYTKEENLLIQIYMTVKFLGELNNNSILDSNYYKNLTFNDEYVKSVFPRIGIFNQGFLLMALYSMFLIPKENGELSKKLNKLNSIKLGDETSSTYKSDKKEINYVRHIRNAIAHATVTIKENNIIFEDKKKNTSEYCKITIPLKNFDRFFWPELDTIFKEYIEFLKKKYSEK